MKNKLRERLKNIAHGKLEPAAKLFFDIIAWLERIHFQCRYRLENKGNLSQEDIKEVEENVTFMFKSFERQKLAKRLYKNIRRFYPNAHIVIADDSSSPLNLKDKHLTVLQLPFNSGLSYGLNRALREVKTPYLMKLDDDCILTRRSDIAGQLSFLNEHKEIDLVGFGILSFIRCQPPIKDFMNYFQESMYRAPKPLKIPHMTQIDGTHIVVGKPPNIFLARTDKIREVGWDDNIRMMDHKEFFIRAAGNLVATVAIDTVVFHCHNPFDRKYQHYRQDVDGDRAYIRKKYAKFH